MKQYSTKDIRNVVLLGSTKSGKTTLSEAMLYEGKVIATGISNYSAEEINLIKKNPFQTPPSYEVLTKDLKGYYSRRINKQHRLVFEVIAEEKRINIISMWTHCEF